MKVVGKPPSMTATQAYFCRVMLARRRARQPCVHVLELAAKFNCTDETIYNQALGRYVKHHEFEARRG